MNDKIKELAQQAGVIALSENGIAPPLDKFAFSIIEECAKIADCPSSFKHKHGYKIRKYFGVAE